MLNYQLILHFKTYISDHNDVFEQTVSPEIDRQIFTTQ